MMNHAHHHHPLKQHHSFQQQEEEEEEKSAGPAPLKLSKAAQEVTPNIASPRLQQLLLQELASENSSSSSPTNVKDLVLPPPPLSNLFTQPAPSTPTSPAWSESSSFTFPGLATSSSTYSNATTLLSQNGSRPSTSIEMGFEHLLSEKRKMLPPKEISEARQRDIYYLRKAIDLARRCVQSKTAYNVGAVLLDAQNNELSTGFSRELPGNTHAEECCLLKLSPPLPSKMLVKSPLALTAPQAAPQTAPQTAPQAASQTAPQAAPQAAPQTTALTNGQLEMAWLKRAQGGTIYTTMEPCSLRLSGKRSCTAWLIEAGVARVVMGLREPDVFVDRCLGEELLAKAGIQVDFLEGFEQACLVPNMHLFAEDEELGLPRLKPETSS